MNTLNQLSDELRLVRDNNYGSQNAEKPEEWDGMVGELKRRVSFIYV